MNPYIDAQVKNIIAVVHSFKASCEMAAMKDDGTYSKDEIKNIRIINKATQRYIEELSKLK